MKKFALCGLALLLPFGAVQAAEKQPVYVFGAAAYEFSKAKDGDKTVKFNSKGGEIGIGYQFNPYLATELSLEGRFGAKLSSSDVETVDGVETGNKSTTKGSAQAVRLGVLGLLPVTDSLNVFAKASIGYEKATFKTTGTRKGSDSSQDFAFKNTAKGIVPALGVGLTYKLTDNLAVRSEVEYRLDRKQYGDLNRKDNKQARNNSTAVKLGLQYTF